MSVPVSKGSKEDNYAFHCVGPSMTHQSFADECDIANIMRKFEKSGLIDHVSRYQGQYGDFVDVVDYKTALDVVLDAEEMFMTIPADVRAKFDNDPGQFLDFVNDPANQEQMIEMGLAERISTPSSVAAAEASKPSDSGSNS